MNDVTWEQFHSALTKPSLRESIGLAISDADAQQLRGNDAWARDYYDTWVQMAVIDDDDLLFDEPVSAQPFSRRAKIFATLGALTFIGLSFVAGTLIGTASNANVNEQAVVSQSLLSEKETSFVNDARAIAGLPSITASEEAGDKTQAIDKLNAQLIQNVEEGCTLDLSDAATRETFTAKIVAENVFTAETAPELFDRISVFCYGG